jgi:UPF0271 protein
MMIDLNADLGEGFGRWHLTDDEQLLSVVTSANVACGFHAGDAATMRRVCELAAERGVRIGAQVSYRDLAGSGGARWTCRPTSWRPKWPTRSAPWRSSPARRARACRTSSRTARSTTASCTTRSRPAAVVDGVLLADATLPVLGLPGSRLLDVAGKAGLPAVTEAFADRAYTEEGTLVPRGRDGAVSPTRGRRGTLGGPGPFWTVVTSHLRGVTSRYGPAPCACTATRPARSTWPAGSGARLEESGVRVEAFA